VAIAKRLTARQRAAILWDPSTFKKGRFSLNSALVKRTPKPPPRVAGWLTAANSTALERRIVERAFHDLGIIETPLGSNRSGRIDEWTRRAGLRPPVWWCAVWAGAVFIDCGCLVPADYPATNAWVKHLKPKGRPGWAVLYGRNGVAHHIGIVVRQATDVTLTIEGNRGYAGTTNNGVAVDIGPMLRTDIMGYFEPRLA
jgi:hypothetical protein